MKKKYQKPMARNLGDYTPAEGACSGGWEAAPVCSIGSSYTLCSLGNEFGGLSCASIGRSASNCNPMGVTALP